MASTLFGQSYQGGKSVNAGGSVAGCTDEVACNYDPLAEVNDGSCAYDVSEAITSMTWSLYEADCGNPLESNSLADGPYVFSTDGWIYYQGEPMFPFSGCGYEWSVDFGDFIGYGYYDESIGGMIYQEIGFCALFWEFNSLGCTDPEAYNFDMFVTEDDGSCGYYDNCDNVVNANGEGIFFTGDYNQWNWNVDVQEGGYVDFQEDLLYIEGSNNNNGNSNPLVQVSIEAGKSGQFSFDWFYSTNDESWEADIAYFLNGERIDLVSTFDENGNLNGANNQSGQMSFFANAGDIIGFGIDATDDCCGSATLQISNFKYPASCIGGCEDEMAINYNPEADFGDYYSCEFLNACGDVVSYGGQGSWFVREFEIDTWATINTSNGVFNYDLNEGFYISGPTEILTDLEEVGITHVIETSGIYIINYEANSADENNFCYYSINGEMYTLNPEETFLILELNEGDVFGFGVASSLAGENPAELYIGSFVWPVNCSGGCTDPAALNFNPQAGYSSSASCLYMNGCDQTVNADGNGVGFTGDFALENWMQVSDGNGFISIADNSFTIYGNDESGVSNAITSMSITAPVAGSYSFEWNYGTIDGPEYDVPFVDYTSDYAGLAGNYDSSFETSSQSGYFEVYLEVGDVMEIGINSTDDCCGLGWMEVTNFTFPVDVCELGCTNPEACNFISYATIDDESCEFISCAGCLEEGACNYAPFATIASACDFESCAGCLDATACNYDATATIDSECDFESCAGCTDDSALNFDPTATIDDGSCEFCELPSVSFEVTGCSDGQFMVEVTVDGVGAASPYTLSNDVNDFTSDVSEDGTITAGPFEVGTFVTFTLASNEFESCSETYETQGCPDNVSESNELTFVVYPNPTTGAVVIATNAAGTAVISLFDLSGKDVLEQQAFFTGANLTLDLSSLAAGAYQLHVINANMVSTKQVIVQK